MIKQRKAKKSKRGIYLQDRELRQTNFKVGTHFKYVIGKNQVVILPSENEKDNTVSKRQLKDGLKPVIDIRNKKALKVFDGCDYLQVTIYEDKILVEGYIKEEETLLDKAKRKTKNLLSKSKVKDITQILKVKQKARVVLSKNQVKKAVGLDEIGQISILESLTSNTESTNVIDLKERFKNLIIPLKVASFFSGHGIMDLGFVMAGFDVVFALEINEAACKTYKFNLGHDIICADIRDIKDELIPNVNVMIGGPPCKPFSKQNQIKRLEEHEDSELILEYIKKIKANKDCKVFVLENTPELITAANGKYLEMVLTNLSDFDISYDIVTDSKLGGYQKSRDRAIIIGSKIGKIKIPKELVAMKHYKTVRDGLAGITEDMPNQKDCSTPSKEVIERMSYVGQGENYKAIPEHLRTKAKHSNSYRRLHPDQPSITLVNYRKPVITHPFKNAYLSGREAARLTSIADEYILKGNTSDIQQGIGNGVPSKMAYWIAQTIRKAIEKWNSKYQLANSF